LRLHIVLATVTGMVSCEEKKSHSESTITPKLLECYIMFDQ